jgi:TolB-like protein
MAEPTKAVFLSYAREDADAARRIADALRSQGVEVWFDQNELRGGDAWDANIKKQIRECTLFLAVVSAQTQERAEGYFRREWKLAAERTSDMAAGTTFLIPVVIDDTAEVQAVAPEEFMRVQWTRLPGALPTPDFVAQIKSLLGGGARRRPTLAPMAQNVTAVPMRTRPPMTALPPLAPKTPGPVEAPPTPKKSRRGALVGTLLVIALLGAGAGYFFFLREPEPVPPPLKPAVAMTPKPASAPATPAEPAINDKSIAVLPFDNMSADKENAFFADGVHEDLLTNLAKVADLKVISRTSVMEYRGTTKKIQQIATELGVAYVLEGSVRRQGNKVRITVQLIDGKTGQHALAPDPYDRDLSDIFAIQSEVAQSIAAKLQAALSPHIKAALDRAPTANLAAYELYLKAREIAATEPDLRIRTTLALPLLERAVQLDPSFALGWHQLGTVHLAAFTSNGFDQSPARAAQAKAAIDRAVALDPENVAIMALLANYYIDVNDLGHAEEQFARLARLYPNQSATFHVQARLAVRQGRPADALASYCKARELDPRSPQILEALGTSLWAHRQYKDALAVQRDLLAVAGDSPGRALGRALLVLDITGSPSEAEAVVTSIRAQTRKGPEVISILSGWAAITGDADEMIRLWQESGPDWRFGTGGGADEGLAIATALVIKGQPERARPILEKERLEQAARVAARPEDSVAWFRLAMTHALAGEKEAALDVRQKMQVATAGVPPGLRRFNDEMFYIWVGEKDLALAELSRDLAKGGALSVNRMRKNIFFRPLQGDPRFEALMNDPKNNAPIL